MRQASTRRLLDLALARNSVETGLPLEVNNATVVLGAAEHARPIADSPALAVTQACARHPAETARSRVTRNATTVGAATGLVGMDAVRLAP